LISQNPGYHDYVLQAAAWFTGENVHNLDAAYRIWGLAQVESKRYCFTCLTACLGLIDADGERAAAG
jgi:hypothetical protein